jgi:S-adenosylmethionine decarboxylase|tara:strand:- start:299 stop:703 length:405 start_codon:yes stop_codon:yes gene_type:complete
MDNQNGLCNIKKLHGKGNHLIIDGYSSSNKLLKDVEGIKKLLINLPKKIGMRAISRPLVIAYKAKSKDNSQNGITGTVILAESNITIHTYPKFNFFCLDIFSCNEFPIKNTIDYLTNKLKIIKYEKKLLKRGFY